MPASRPAQAKEPSKSAPPTPASQSKEKAKSTEKTTASPGAGASLWGSVRGWIAEKVNPDAKVAKMGEQMDAYFDKEKNRWVFPGEDAQEDDGPPAAPPTAAEMMSQQPKQEEKPVADDPLAALMAPTPRASVPTAGFGSTTMLPPNLRSQSMPNFAVFSPRGGAGGAKRMEPVHEGVVFSGASAPKAGNGNGTGRP